MAEQNKNIRTEDDPIKSMLEKLRQSVGAPKEGVSAEKDVFVAEEEVAIPDPVSAPIEPKRKQNMGTTRRKATETSTATNAKKEEKTPTIQEIDIFTSLGETGAEPEADAPAGECELESESDNPVSDDSADSMELATSATCAEEDVEEEDSVKEELEIEDSDVDESVIAQFFAAVEEDAEIPAAEEDVTEDSDGREYDVISFEDQSSLYDEEEGYALPSETEKEIEIDEISWQSVDDSAEKTEDVLFAEETIKENVSTENTEEIAISDQEAALLFRAPTPKKTYSTFLEEEISAEEKVQEESAVIANEENGYAVEVEVHTPAGAWYMPTAAQVEEVRDTLQPAEELIEKVRAEEERIAPPEVIEPQSVEAPTSPYEEVEGFEADDIDEMDAPIFYGGEETVAESAPLEEAVAQPIAQPAAPAPDPVSTVASEEPKPSARHVLAAFFGGKGNRAKRKKVWNAKPSRNAAPDALSGIYNEAGADYHEYTSRNQIGLFTERFKAELTSCTVRIFALAFLCTLLLILENLGHVGITLGGFFAQPGGMAAAHLILLAFVVLCSVPMFSYAWRHLFGNRVLPEIYMAMCLLFTLLYDVYLLLASVPTPYLFGLVPALGVLALSIVEWIKIKGDFSAFKLVSSAGDKLACSISAGAQTREEGDAVADLEEGKDTRILSVKKVGFTVGFFHRVSRICEDGRKNLWLLITAMVASVMAAIIGGVFSSSFDVAFYIFCVTISFAFPICSVMLHKIPVAQLFRRASANRCAVVGEVSAIEYCDAAAAAFEDVEAFPARNVRVQRIKLYGDSALDRVLYQVAGLFSTVGGPLDGVFRSSTAELGLSTQACLVRVEEGGIVAMVDGCEVCVGRGEYMLKNRIRMYYDPEDESILTNGKVNIMYAAENGRLIAKFYVRYKMDEDFEKEIEQLHKRGIRTLIRTYDPNIGGDLIANISYTGRFGVRVVKKTVEQQNDFAVARLNSGIVSRATTRHILRTLFACRRMCRMISVAENASLLLACGGMLLSLILSVFGTIFAIPTIFFALYQLLWIGIVALVGKFYI